MSDEDDRARALPLWGEAKLPDSRDRDISEDQYSFSTIFKLFLRSWPFIYTQIGGQWRERGTRVAALEAGAAQERGYRWMPPVLTLLWLWGFLGDFLAVGPDAREAARLWSSVGGWSLGVLVVSAWATLPLRGWRRVVVAGVGVGAGFLGVFLTGVAASGPGARIWAVCLWAIYIAGWFIHLRVAEGRPRAAVRVKSHLVYFYALQWLSRLIALATGAYVIGLLYQNVLQGQPLTPLMASVLMLPELSSEVVDKLSIEQRHALKWTYVYVTVGLWFAQFPFRLLLPVYTVWILQQILARSRSLDVDTSQLPNGGSAPCR